MKIPRKTAAVPIFAGWGVMGILVFHEPLLLGSLLAREMGPVLKCLATELIGKGLKGLHQAVQAAPDAPNFLIALAWQNLGGGYTDSMSK